ncbi:glycosyltransferase [Spirosoma rhododendri]|uniref:Glycosyltransferase family 1 protein n=1 Tax=Spirosoma rhododendri TaxID=2728024 RepID=A0A7L5DLR1_9BACT|nr:glycosyltransferase [Spirosoma rhododendri]QJD77017.1 glycosyltransferase family 1 protein [Spirosoma rhododendri]
MDYVIVGLQPWNLPLGGNCKDIALELAKAHRVLYVNPPDDWLTALRRTQAADPADDELMHVGATCWVLTPRLQICPLNWLPDGWLYDRLNYWNNRRVAQCIQQTVKQLGFADVVLFNDSDMVRSFYLPDLLKPRQFIYYTRDNLLAIGYWQRHGQRLEPALMRKATFVAANSAYLARLARQHNPRTVDIGQGCDLHQFDPAVSHPEPDELTRIAHPRIGYLGALNAARLTIDWLVLAAHTHPDWQLVLIGPEDDAFRQSALHELPNVHFLGAKPMAQLPAYLAHLDVAINPQQLNELTIGNYPRKIDEYLAMGKPVVALKTETMALFADYVRLAANGTEFVEHIRGLLDGYLPAPPDACIAFARQHTWAHSVGLLVQAQHELISHQPTLVDTLRNEPV